MRDIDQIIRVIVSACPTIKARQLSVSHPGADDDGLWFFDWLGSEFEVQAESPNGMCPFLIETDENNRCLTANSIQGTVEIITNLLHIGPLGAIPPR